MPLGRGWSERFGYVAGARLRALAGCVNCDVGLAVLIYLGMRPGMWLTSASFINCLTWQSMR